MRPSRAFTLIELLVVIAIIGILSAIALSSLNAARQRASDTTTLANMRALTRQVEIVTLDRPSTSYPWTQNATALSIDESIPSIFSDPNVQGSLRGIISSAGSVSFGAIGNQYVVVSPARSSGAFCIDNTLAPGGIQIDAIPTFELLFTRSGFTCPVR